MTRCAGFITPEWPAPAQVRALVTTRQGGCSQGPYASNNLAQHVGDQPAHVTANRTALLEETGLDQIQWLQQVHGTVIVQATPGAPVEADGVITQQVRVPCAVLTADCLPVLLCDSRGRQVAAVHAGWRGLAEGILPSAIKRMQAAPEDILVYLGPAISAAHFEVGAEVKSAFTTGPVAEALGSEYAAAAARCFCDSEAPGGAARRFYGDLYQLARSQCAAMGVAAIYGGDFCTYTDSDRFYSYRRDGRTGRMASMIWLA